MDQQNTAHNSPGWLLQCIFTARSISAWYSVVATALSPPHFTATVIKTNKTYSMTTHPTR